MARLKTGNISPESRAISISVKMRYTNKVWQPSIENTQVYRVYRVWQSSIENTQVYRVYRVWQPSIENTQV